MSELRIEGWMRSAIARRRISGSWYIDEMTAAISITHEENGHRGGFVVDRNGSRLAEMTYTRAGDDLVIIDHTEVSDALRGQGVGKKLVEAAVEWARANGVKLLPLCPFARSTFDRHPELHDVLGADSKDAGKDDEPRE